MSNIPNLLRKQAEELRGTTSDPDLVKQAALAEMIELGMEKSAAEGLIDGYLEFNPISVDTDMSKAEELEKLATYIEGLEAELEEARSQVKIEKTDLAPLTKLSEAGFTDNELQSLRGVPEETLTKLASLAQEPWELGQGSGMAHTSSDPFLEFLLN